MKLLQKMGWKPGQVIGKRGEGYAEPIALTVKIDRKGLSTGKEKQQRRELLLCWTCKVKIALRKVLSLYLVQVV